MNWWRGFQEFPVDYSFCFSFFLSRAFLFYPFLFYLFTTPSLCPLFCCSFPLLIVHPHCPTSLTLPPSTSPLQHPLVLSSPIYHCTKLATFFLSPTHHNCLYHQLKVEQKPLKKKFAKDWLYISTCAVYRSVSSKAAAQLDIRNATQQCHAGAPLPLPPTDRPTDNDDVDQASNWWLVAFHVKKKNYLKKK